MKGLECFPINALLLKEGVDIWSILFGIPLMREGVDILVFYPLMGEDLKSGTTKVIAKKDSIYINW